MSKALLVGSLKHNFNDDVLNLQCLRMVKDDDTEDDLHPIKKNKLLDSQ